MSESWNLSERDVTPESAGIDRRAVLKWLGLGTLAFASGAGLWWWRRRGTDAQVLGTGRADGNFASFFPAKRNARFADADRPISPEAPVARYSNFYEFSGNKDVWRYVEPFQPIPWKVEVGGVVALPRVYDLDDLHSEFPLEERIYRHRCVEAWAMVIPWTGFPLAALRKKAEPLPAARYVRFESFYRPEEAGRQRSDRLPWPYTEGLTLAEATNELAFIATGMYGHPLLKQHGAPVRLVVPWKYGFKSIKSIVKIKFVKGEPPTTWSRYAPTEYGFYSNVNPNVDHPRWSQATERRLGEILKRKTLMFNGYSDQVASLYTGMDLKKNY